MSTQKFAKMPVQSGKTSYLPNIHSPADLRVLPNEAIPALCQEIRDTLVETVTRNGGHLASNLGAVELSVAMHRVFDCPRDHFIFDVGHQSYVHKLLTGRYDRFHTLRQGGGLSGFTKRSESEYDCFGAGHSSTSLSAALGFAQGDRMAGSDAYTIAVVGDGAFTGGMIHEALNNITPGLRLIIIINENEMSISKNIGRFATHMARLRRKSGYFKTKKGISRFIKRIPLIGNGLFCAIRDTKKAVKNAMYGSNYFEDMGLYYLGPADGNDYEAVEALLTEAKKQNESVVIHLKTRKGKGYEPAEADPGRYHGMAPADKQSADKLPAENFSHRLGEILIAESRQDDRICAITASMSEGTGLESFHAARPDRFFDVGIAEEHALTFAAGLAADGYKPVTAIYSSFMQRGYDQVIHDIALQNLPVLMCIDRAGLNAGDGPTHHGIFDVSFLSSVPGMTIYTPVTFAGLALSVRRALEAGVPAAIRYPNGGEDDRLRETFYPNGEPTDIGVRESDPDNATLPEAIIVTHGRITSEALIARDQLADEGILVGILLCEYLKPYGRLADEVAARLPDGVPVLFLEEEIRAGGFGMMLSDALIRCGAMANRPYTILATDDSFVHQDTHEPIFRTAGVDAESIAVRLRELIRH
ncbi:MAG: 1-deoxy-D-xylulose-5-phosphate synthase [Clostridia bacterium]|nr:1-deoxy-D-xylulose-5-phosphate synthase [Clostridia bacterium]